MPLLAGGASWAAAAGYAGSLGLMVAPAASGATRGAPEDPYRGAVPPHRLPEQRTGVAEKAAGTGPANV